MMVLGLIVIIYLSARFMIPQQAALILLVLYFAIIVAITGNLGLWTLVVFIVGSFAYFMMSSAMRRA